jgi:hypothetical protein
MRKAGLAMEKRISNPERRRSNDRNDERAELLLVLSNNQRRMASLRISLPFALSVILLCCPSALAKTAFISSEIEGPGSEIFFCDLDGDQVKEAVLIDGLDLSIFYQEAKQGFPRKPQQKFRLDDRPSLIWPARLGGNAESLLVMTSEGVAELCFTNRTGPPMCRQIIRQQTIVPESVKETSAIYFPLSAATGAGWPLLLVPVPGGLQVWSTLRNNTTEDGQHRDAWFQVQFIEQAVDTHMWPSIADPGYTRAFGLSLSLGDVNGDGRDDLMLRRNDIGGMQTYALRLRSADGLFALKPALTFTNKADSRTTLCWIDINRDGRLDLIKSTTSDEPSFIPGFRSAKVLVAIHLADAHGGIPAEPQQVFRKKDWSPFLPTVDVDGDGFMDMVLGYINMDTREGARKAITAQEVDLNLTFQFYRPGAGFPKDPDFQRSVRLHIYSHFHWDLDRRLYYEQFVSFNGDFNGDGKKDLLVRDHSDAISVYFFVSRENGFNSRTDLSFRCPGPIEWWQVEDLNGDGLSDVIVKVQKQDLFRIYTSQNKQPLRSSNRTDAVETTDGHR